MFLYDDIGDLGGSEFPPDCVWGRSRGPYSGATGWIQIVPPSLARFVMSWKMTYPQAPPVNIWAQKLNAKEADFYAIRPPTKWDPALDGQPILGIGDKRLPIFNAALILFFPDMMYDVLGNQYKPYESSMTAWGPFPLRTKFVNDAMVEFAARYLQSPNAFGNPEVARQFDAAGSAIGAAATGFSIGMSAGPIAGAVVAAASFIVDIFSSLFGGPSTPDWLKELLKIRQLRESGGQPSFKGANYDKICPRVQVRAAPGGRYTLMEGYERVLQVIGRGRRPPNYLAYGVAGGAILAGIFLLSRRSHGSE